MEASELELRARMDALEAELAELRAEAEGAFDLGCEYPGEGTTYAIEVPTQQVFGGIGNGGGAAFALGPITYDSDNNKVVQYLGRFNAEGVFTPLKNNGGAMIVGADYGAPIQALKKGSDTTVVTETLFKPQGKLPASSAVMSKHSIGGLTANLTYTPPNGEGGSGALTGNSGVAFGYWGDRASPGYEQTYLTTIVEEANEKTIYEHGGSSDGGGDSTQA